MTALHHEGAPLVWTREHPQEADRWYWMLVPNGRPECVWVHEEIDGWYIDDTEYGEQNPIPISDVIQFAQWAGPIPAPTMSEGGGDVGADSLGKGDIYSTQGQVKEWLTIQDERARIETRRQEDADA